MSENVFVRGESNSSFEAMTKEQVLAAITQAVEGGTIGDVDTGFVTIIKEQNKGQGLMFWVGTTAEYEALATKPNNVLYIKTDDTSAADISSAISALQAADNNFTEQISTLDTDLTEVKTDVTDKIHFLGVLDPTTTLQTIFETYGSYCSYKLAQIPDTSIYPVSFTPPTQSTNGAFVTFEATNNVGKFTFEKDGETYIKHVYTSAGGFTAGGWIKLQDGTDSGWQTLTISGTGFSAGSTTPQYRKIGNRVYIRGQIIVDMATVTDITTVFTTLPDGYRPSVAKYQLLAGEGDRMARLYIRTGGGVNINYFKEYDGTTVTGSHWIQIDSDFMTD